eukprot:TRINITY_DN1446_c0_g2_i1.p1 TRINITY_DN1446_c0_g2~~TRINITY_DN1446_c0_g2_i1.p1  ORF type:complete len:342 (+),score=2.39 TRINITY_DN1446_c0_g2_i1:336-1361(+)
MKTHIHRFSTAQGVINFKNHRDLSFCKISGFVGQYILNNFYCYYSIHILSMFRTCALLLVFLECYIYINGQKTLPDDDDDDFPRCNCRAPQSSTTVCCSGQEFLSVCHASCQGIGQCTQGKCPTIRPCTDDNVEYCCGGVTKYGPSSCTDDSAYPFDINQCTKGKCPPACSCTQDVVPLCCDGRNVQGSSSCVHRIETGGLEIDYDCYTANTDDNECADQCCNIIADECTYGTCDDACPDVCTQEYDPVCCNDQTYGNKCEACPVYSDKDCYKGECHLKQCDCSDDQMVYCCYGMETLGLGPSCNKPECGGSGMSGCRPGPCQCTGLRSIFGGCGRYPWWL